MCTLPSLVRASVEKRTAVSTFIELGLNPNRQVRQQRGDTRDHQTGKSTLHDMEGFSDITSMTNAPRERAGRWRGCAVAASLLLLCNCQHNNRGAGSSRLSPNVHHPTATRHVATAPVPKLDSARARSADDATGKGLEPGRQVEFIGACDASGAVPLGAHRFVVADDEDNWLRIYDADQGGPPLRQLDTSPHLHLNGKSPESDLEAATHIGDEAYWLASHGRNHRGRHKAERLLFFATRLPSIERDLQLIGKPYRDLLDDMLREPKLARFELDVAAALPPKAVGGLNIEGLTATPEQTLLLGFRTPIPGGRALLLPIANPRQIARGTRAEFGEPIELELGGLGVRALSWWRGRYLIIAGPHDAGTSRLYSWRGPEQPPELMAPELLGLNPEAFFTPEERGEILLLSDDGTRLIDGKPCKSLESHAKRFRGVWLRPAYATAD